MVYVGSKVSSRDLSRSDTGLIGQPRRLPSLRLGIGGECFDDQGISRAAHVGRLPATRAIRTSPPAYNVLTTEDWRPWPSDDG